VPNIGELVAWSRPGQRDAFEIHAVRPACTALGTVVCEDVHQRHAIVGSGSRENVQQMCRLLHCGSVLVATDVRDIATVHERRMCKVELK